MAKLELPREVEERLVAMLGKRYDREQGIIKITADKFPRQDENKWECKRILKHLVTEAWKAHPNFVPVDQEPLQPSLSYDPAPRLTWFSIDTALEPNSNPQALEDLKASLE